MTGRRKFFAIAAAGLAGVVRAPGIRLIAIARAADPQPAGQQGANPDVRWGMLIDTTQCQPGCDDCVRACRTENGLPQEPGPNDSQWIRKVDLKEIGTGRVASVPVMCQHCANPPCVNVCPTGASFKRADGIVLVDRHLCIGCRYCLMACPFKARSFVGEPITNQKSDVPRGRGTSEGCTLCVHRLDAGNKITACAEACAKAGHNAIVFGDLNDPHSEIASRVRELQSRPLRQDMDLDTGVRYHGV
jgi:molybdopterin-containing oxidoreductase family iron-sulfur binding subunit